MFGFGKKKKPETVSPLPPLSPLFVWNECGKFTMGYNYKNEPDGVYCGTVEWRGQKIKAEVACDTDDMTADKGFAKLSEMLADDAKWDSRIKDYAVRYALENWGNDKGLIEIWGSGYEDEDAEPITQDQFVKELELSNFTIYKDGSMDFCFPVDGLFTDHELLISVNSNGDFDGGGLQG